MTTRIGHARADENNKAKGGKAGDQTNKEILVQDWYLHSKGWLMVFRAKDTKIAEKIAATMEQACNNDNIGYDQSQRTTLYEQAKKFKWDVSKIKNQCECDCSSLVAVCVNAAGVPISKDMYTGNQKQLLTMTGKFEVLEALDYLTKPDNLKRGDILLGNGHTAIVLNTAPKKPSSESAKSFSKTLAGNYLVTATKLNVRCGAGVSKKVLIVLPKNTKVQCYGYYTKVLDTIWLFVQFTYKTQTYVGFVSAKYVAKCS